MIEQPKQYFCLHCNRTHVTLNDSNCRIFKTGFRFLPNGQKINIGYCIHVQPVYSTAS